MNTVVLKKWLQSVVLSLLLAVVFVGCGSKDTYHSDDSYKYEGSSSIVGQWTAEGIYYSNSFIASSFKRSASVSLNALFSNSESTVVVQRKVITRGNSSYPITSVWKSSLYIVDDADSISYLVDSIGNEKELVMVTSLRQARKFLPELNKLFEGLTDSDQIREMNTRNIAVLLKK